MSLYTQIIGVIAVVLGVAWIVAPRTMIDFQYNVLYFWVDEPDTEHASETAGRIGGVLLAALGGALAAGILP